MFQQYFKFLLYGSLGLVASLYIAGCQPSPSQQVYEVSGAKVCDAYQKTPTTQDDCDNPQGFVGYYYNPVRSSIFYRTGSGKSIVVEQNVPRPSSTAIGGLVPLSQPVITNSSGIPLMDNNGSVVRTPSRSNPSISTTPVRSTASFNAPGMSVKAGKASSTTSRGLSFGHSSGSNSSGSRSSNRSSSNNSNSSSNSNRSGSGGG